jgi:hypothetical protein
MICRPDLKTHQSQDGLFARVRDRGSFYPKFLQQLIAILAGSAKASRDFSMSYRASRQPAGFAKIEG